MSFSITDFAGLYIYEPRVHADDRGYFFESYNEETFQREHLEMRFIQDNQSYSTHGVIRGLHYQLNPHAQTKLVRVLSGRIQDVVVDLRKGSRTFGRHFSIEMSAENKKQILVPKGFAHGFSVLSEYAEVSYKCDAFYHKDSEGGIRFDDPALGIDWRIDVTKAKVSAKDRELPLLSGCRNNFEFV